MIKVEGISKLYRIPKVVNTQPTLHQAFLSHLKRPVHAIFQTPENLDSRMEMKDFWALKNVSFDVSKGEVVGIIGRNGAGKSTILKIISRITYPTSGKITINGRLSSLLEVGTGFHPELSGRENVYLSGTILGMKRWEIDNKFEQIVDFSNIREFIDTQVKHYSSGMQVRLAFSIAAHLEPEILLIDEVLAVGDADFQKKCLAKMGEAAEGGKTVLFVSHNMAAITRLCNRGILLDSGTVIEDGTIQSVVKKYMESAAGSTALRQYPEPSTRPGNDIVRLHEVKVVDKHKRLSECPLLTEPIGIMMKFEVLKDGYELIPNYHFLTSMGIYAFVVSDWQSALKKTILKKGIYQVIGWIPANLLNEETYNVGAAVSSFSPKQVHFFERDAVAFRAIDSLNNPTRGSWGKQFPGVVRPIIEWTTNYYPKDEL